MPAAGEQGSDEGPVRRHLADALLSVRTAGAGRVGTAGHRSGKVRVRAVDAAVDDRHLDALALAGGPGLGDSVGLEPVLPLPHFVGSGRRSTEGPGQSGCDHRGDG